MELIYLLIIVLIAAFAYFTGHYIGYGKGESEQAAYAEEMRDKERWQELREARKGGR